MIIAGIDLGSKFAKVVILRDGEIIGSGSELVGFDRLASTEKAFQHALESAGISRNEVSRIVATGAGKEVVSFAEKDFTTIACDAKGINRVLPSVRTVIDTGAELARAIRLDGKGNVATFAVNEKCAAGAGTFVEAMARAVEIPLEEFTRISLKSQKDIPLNAQCVVFAESEVVSLIHEGVEEKDIARAVHNAMASRVGAMAQTIKVEKDVAFIGGVARNVGFVDSLKSYLKEELLIPENPDLISALGAALLGQE